MAWFFVMGLLIPGFTLSWTVAKEVNRPEHSGIATSVVNVGIFLGTGVLQPLVGFVLDRGRAAGDVRGCVGPRDAAAGRRRGAGRAGHAHGPRGAEAGGGVTAAPA